MPQPATVTDPAIEARVDALVARMTLEEKVDMLAGETWMETLANERLGIPAIRMADGPVGVRTWHFPFGPGARDLPRIEATAFPCGAAMAATWNPGLVRRVGAAMGREARALGRDMLLGPTVNIHRLPQGGRNFESYGEDPWLAARMAVAAVEGIQSEGVIACVKHFAVNNQEHDRFNVDVEIDERTLHEIYLPAFRAAVVEAGAWSVMSAYNKVNGAWCAENPYLLHRVLKEGWAFRGFVVSDWVSTHTAVESANAGLDLEMPCAAARRLMLGARGGPRLLTPTGEPGDPDGYFRREHLLPAVAAGAVAPAVIDDKVRRMLRAMLAMGLFERAGETAPGTVPDHRAVARESAVQGIVLLKNEDILPLADAASIGVIGPNAGTTRTGGGGSSFVRAAWTVTPFDGVRARAGESVTVAWAQGCAMEGEDPAGQTPEDRSRLIAEATSLARDSAVAVVVVGYTHRLETEGFDRPSLDLPAGQDELIEAVAAANPNTVVIVQSGGPVAMDRWLGKVRAVLVTWFAGSATGDAIADVLFGDACPSGRLPVTFPRRLEDSPAQATYPGTGGRLRYGEGLFVGYRHYDRGGIEPLFPFGFGLSYTTFSFENARTKVVGGPGVEVTVDVRNTGSRRGAEVVQAYVRRQKPRGERPEQELRAFERVDLAPGEAQSVTLRLGRDAFSVYDIEQHDWRLEPGTFEVLLGTSSRDIRARLTIAVEA